MVTRELPRSEAKHEYINKQQKVIVKNSGRIMVVVIIYWRPIVGRLTGIYIYNFESVDVYASNIYIYIYMFDMYHLIYLHNMSVVGAVTDVHVCSW